MVGDSKAPTNLQEVWFHGNLLEELPEDIGQLQNLEKLYLSGNRLQSLPDSLSKLGALKELSLSGNLLQELPPSIGRLGRHLLSEDCHNVAACNERCADSIL